MTRPDFDIALDAFAARLSARAGEAERLRRLPDETIADAAALGFFHLLAPKALGGAALPFRDFLDHSRRLAQACASSAWTLSFLSLHCWLLCKFTPELQAELFVDGAMPLAPAPLAPTGKCVATDGGYRINGRWEWATGIMHADWVMVTCIEEGAIGPRFCVLPIGDVTVDDVWHVAGMCATGSNVVRAKDVFVPAHRTLEALRLRGGTAGEAAHADDARIRYPMGATLALVAATPALGAAEGAIAAYKTRMQAKVQAYSGGVRQGELAATHLRLGEALAYTRAAHAVWTEAIGRLEEIGPHGAAAPVEALEAIRLASASIVRFANEAVNILAASAGASSGFLDAPLQRHLRDLQMMRGHVVFDWDRAAQISGRLALGGEPTPTDML